MPGKDRGNSGAGLRRKAPPGLTIIAVALLVLVLCAGGFYAFNGSWKTAGQQDEEYKHNLLPLMAAKHGDMEPLEAENRYRKEHGQAPLTLPDDKQARNGGDQRAKLEALQKQLQGKTGN